jgi:hypothetical protein
VSEWFLAWLIGHLSWLVVSVPAGRWKVKPKGNKKNFNERTRKLQNPSQKCLFSTIDQKAGVYALISVRKTRVFFTVKKKILRTEKIFSDISKIQNKLRRKFY